MAKKSKPKKPKPPSENEDDFLDTPVTTRTLLVVVAHAIQKIKHGGNDDQAVQGNYLSLRHDLLNITGVREVSENDNPQWAKRGEGSI